MQNKSTLVTGASGFLGGHVVNNLLESGYSGCAAPFATWHVVRVFEPILRNSGVDVTNLSFVELDLTRDAGWAEAMQGVDTFCCTPHRPLSPMCQKMKVS